MEVIDERQETINYFIIKINMILIKFLFLLCKLHFIILKEQCLRDLERELEIKTFLNII